MQELSEYEWQKWDQKRMKVGNKNKIIFIDYFAKIIGCYNYGSLVPLMLIN